MSYLETYVARALEDGGNHTLEDVQKSVKHDLISTLAHMNCGPLEVIPLAYTYRFWTNRLAISHELGRLARDGQARQIPRGKLLPAWHRRSTEPVYWKRAA